MLRKAAEGDGPLLVAWRNRAAGFFPPGPELTAESHARWWREVYVPDPWDHLFVVVADGQPAGTAGIHVRSGEISRVLLGEVGLRRRGVMSEALSLLMDGYGRSRSYWLRVLPGNDAAVWFYQRNGFTAEHVDGGFLVMRHEAEIAP